MIRSSIMPRRRKPERSGIQRAPRREWPRHRAFLRRHHCVVPGCISVPIEVSHIRTASNAGTGLKPHDAFAVSMCQEHHHEYHRAGHRAFEHRHRLNLNAIAAEFVRRSPDAEMRASLPLQSGDISKDRERDWRHPRQRLQVTASS